jgi:hypothetical protein
VDFFVVDKFLDPEKELDVHTIESRPLSVQRLRLITTGAKSVRHLNEFCGDLAATFPGTSSVESDFSIVNWEKDDCRICLTDIWKASTISSNSTRLAQLF